MLMEMMNSEYFVNFVKNVNPRQNLKIKKHQEILVENLKDLQNILIIVQYIGLLL